METLAENQEIIGLGLYLPAEAARYARVRTAKFNQWVFSETPVFTPQLGRERKLATFLDFAQSLAVNDIRLTANVPLQRIRAAYHEAQKFYGIEYPFAREHGIFIFGNVKNPKNCDIGIYLPKSGEKEPEFAKRCVQLTGKKKGQLLISQVIQEFSKDLLYDENGEAEGYIAYRGHGQTIKIDPNVRFGKPYLVGHGYEAESLAAAVHIEGSVKRVAKLYLVSEAVVKAALDYHKLLNTKPPKQSPKSTLLRDKYPTAFPN